MADLTGAERVENVLAHYGKKGMRWGVRKSRVSAGSSAPSSSSKPAPSKQGDMGKIPASAKDKSGRIKKGGGPKDITDKPKQISDEELRARINRINMEQQYAKLTTPAPTQSKGAKAAKIVGDILLDVGKQQAKAILLQTTTSELAKRGLVTPPKVKKDK